MPSPHCSKLFNTRVDSVERPKNDYMRKVVVLTKPNISGRRKY